MAGRNSDVLLEETALKLSARLERPDLKELVKQWLVIWAGSPTTPPRGLAKAELIALQLEAQSIFGGVTSHLDQYATRPDVLEVRRLQGSFIRAFLQAMLLETGEEMKERGITRVTLWRGAKEIAAPAQSETFKVIALPLQPITSFTHNLAQAVRFTRREKGTLFLVSVPTSRILATPATGFGVLEQREEIVFSPPAAVKLLDEGLVAQSDDWELWQEISSYTMEDWVELLEDFESQEGEST